MQSEESSSTTPTASQTNPDTQSSAADELPPPSQSSRRHRDSMSSAKGSDITDVLSPGTTDRVYPIRSVISVDPNSTPAIKPKPQDGYFQTLGRSNRARRQSGGTEASYTGMSEVSNKASVDNPNVKTPGPADRDDTPERSPIPKYDSNIFTDLVAGTAGGAHSKHSSISKSKEPSIKSVPFSEDTPHLITARFKHVVTEGGHAVITGRDGDALQRCEDEPIHIPGAVQGFGLLVALQESDGKYIVRVVSENSAVS